VIGPPGYDRHIERIRYSFVIPAYKEAETLAAPNARLVAVIDEVSVDAELLFVNHRIGRTMHGPSLARIDEEIKARPLCLVEPTLGNVRPCLARVELPVDERPR
jgi:hypothetical protein